MGDPTLRLVTLSSSEGMVPSLEVDSLAFMRLSGGEEGEEGREKSSKWLGGAVNVCRHSLHKVVGQSVQVGVTVVLGQNYVQKVREHRLQFFVSLKILKTLCVFKT